MVCYGIFCSGQFVTQATRSELGRVSFRKDLGLLQVTGKKTPISDQRVPSNYKGLKDQTTRPQRVRHRKQ